MDFLKLAPVILFVYKRPEITLAVLEALSENVLADQSVLFIFSDGPKKNESEEGIKLIVATRSVIRQRKWCKEVIIKEQASNIGLANSIINGVTEIINQYGRAIILEDDILTSKFFLQYMNHALEIYKDEEKVISVGACNFFAIDDLTPNTFFVPIPDCWGWATWQNKWKLFEPNGSLLLRELINRKLMDKFNLSGNYSFEQMLTDQILEKNSSWAIRWQAVAYINDMLCLYPKHSVTKNIGFDGTATHGKVSDLSSYMKFADSTPVEITKTSPVVDDRILNLMNKYYGELFGIKKLNLLTVIKSTIKTKSLKWLPKFILDFLRYIKTPAVDLTKEITWNGNYGSWNEAKSHSEGYDSKIIFEQTLASILMIKNGQKVFERDSVVLDKVEFPWPVLTILLRIGLENKSELKLIDFGGSFGSSYFQNKDFFQSFSTLEWNVVEQSHYINVGNEKLADQHLSFFDSIRQCLRSKNPNVILISSTIQYLESPFEFVNELIEYDFDYIIFDRTAFIENDTDLITVQNVPEWLYKASYPSWFFNYERFIALFWDKYDLVVDFKSNITSDIYLDGKRAYWHGIYFKKKKSFNSYSSNQPLNSLI